MSKYYGLFNETGERITCFVDDIHQDIPAEAIELTEREFQMYITDKYIRDPKTKQPMEKPPYVPTKEDLLNRIRLKRDKLLEESDKYMLPDYPISEQEKEAWKAYRQALRDLPEFCDIYNPIWPEKPGGELD